MGVTELEPRLKALMVRALDGDGPAYAQLLSVLSGYLRGYLGRRLSGRPGDVEDLVQETLLAIHTKRDTFDRTRPFTPWAYALARYKLLDHLRRVGAHPTAPLELADSLFAHETAEEGAVRHDLSRLLDRLPRRQRALMEAVRLEGLTMQEASDRTGMSVGAVKVSLHRSLKTLRKEVSDEDL